MYQKIKKFAYTHRTALAVVGLFCVGFVVYANTLQNGMFWDDNDGILNNTYVHDFRAGKFFSENLVAGAGFESNYWRPLLLFLYSIQWNIWGAWNPGFHFVNFFIHFLNALLVFFLFRKMTKLPPTLLFVVSLIFLVHPLQTEAVTYVSGLGDPLSFLFILLGMYAYHKYRTESARNTLYFFFSLLAFVLALLSKERAVIFPAFLLLVELWLFIKTKGNIKNRIKETVLSLLPFFLIAGIYLLLRGTVLNFQNTFNIYNAENYYTTHIMARIFTFFSMIPEYLSLLIFPKTLFMERTENVAVIASILNIKTLIGICSTLLAAAFAAVRFKKRPEYLFALLFFAIAIFPASGIFIPVAGVIFEHYMYAPIVGFFLFLGIGLYELWHAERFTQWMKITTIGIFSVWIVAIGIRTIIRNAEWRDPVTFYEQTLLYAPGSLRVWNNLGMAYADRGLHEKALYAYGRAIALNLKNPIPYHNSGNTYEELGDMKTAKKYWEAALRIDPNFVPSRMKILEEIRGNHQ